MDVSENSGTPKSSILIGFSNINHLFWGTPIFGNTHMDPLPPMFGLNLPVPGLEPLKEPSNGERSDHPEVSSGFDDDQLRQ